MEQNSSNEDMRQPRPGDPIPPCQDAPTIRVRREDEPYKPRPESYGYTTRGYIEHFLPDREVNLAKLNKALADVFGEPGLRGMRMDLEIDEEYWRMICGDPWSGNVYRYNF
jgi:hypothetical protein